MDRDGDEPFGLVTTEETAASVVAFCDLLRSVLDLHSILSFFPAGHGASQNEWKVRCDVLGKLPAVGILTDWTDRGIGGGGRVDAVVLHSAFSSSAARLDASLAPNLCRRSNVIVLRGAAIASVDSLPEIWPEAWAATFSQLGYACYDVFGRQSSQATGSSEAQRWDAYVFARRGTQEAARLEPWNAEGLVLSRIQLGVALAWLAQIEPSHSANVGLATQGFARALSAWTGEQPAIANPHARWLRDLEDERRFAASMAAVERDAGMRIGEGRALEALEGRRRAWLEQGRRIGIDEADAAWAGRHAAEAAEREPRIERLAKEIRRLEQERDVLHRRLGGLRRFYEMTLARRFAGRLRTLISRRFAGPARAAAVAEIKASGLFDEVYYLSRYPDVAASGRDAVEHYVERGVEEGRNPSAVFDTLSHCADHPELAKTDLNPLLHAIRTRRSAA